MPYTDEHIARIYHAANIEHQAILNDTVPTEPWPSLPQYRQAISVTAVHRIRNGTVTSAQEHHENWVREMAAAGWTYGPGKDVLAQAHPAMLPWAKLPPEMRDKAMLFLDIVRSLSRDDP